MTRCRNPRPAGSLVRVTPIPTNDDRPDTHQVHRDKPPATDAGHTGHRPCRRAPGHPGGPPEIELIGHYRVPVLAVALNLTGVAPQDVNRVVADCRAQSPNIPVVDVVRHGMGNLA